MGWMKVDSNTHCLYVLGDTDICINAYIFHIKTALTLYIVQINIGVSVSDCNNYECKVNKNQWYLGFTKITRNMAYKYVFSNVLHELLFPFFSSFHVPFLYPNIFISYLWSQHVMLSSLQGNNIFENTRHKNVWANANS